MTQDNIQTDTPQEGANEQQYNSLEEAVFGGDITEGSNDVSSAFTNGNEGNTETAPAETGQPEVSNEEVVPQEKTQTLSAVSSDEDIDVDSLENADASAGDGLSLVVDSFPGAKIVTDE